MLPVVCSTLVSPDAAPGDVDWFKATVLTSPSPAALTPLTTNEYKRPPSRPDTVAEVAADPVPSYATVT
jgi:hypothetical protein